MYPDPAALPAIGVAVTRAYLPDMTVRQGLRLFGRVLRGPTAVGVPQPVERFRHVLSEIGGTG